MLASLDERISRALWRARGVLACGAGILAALKVFALVVDALSHHVADSPYPSSPIPSLLGTSGACPAFPTTILFSTVATGDPCPFIPSAGFEGSCGAAAVVVGDADIVGGGER